MGEDLIPIAVPEEDFSLGRLLKEVNFDHLSEFRDVLIEEVIQTGHFNVPEEDHIREFSNREEYRMPCHGS